MALSPHDSTLWNFLAASNLWNILPEDPAQHRACEAFFLAGYADHRSRLHNRL
ncbi:MAG: hypothetical protein ACLSHC_08995 [Bilophila wadsworthia]